MAYLLRDTNKKGKRVYRTRCGGWSPHKSDAVRFEGRAQAERFQKREADKPGGTTVVIEYTAQ